MIKEIIAGYLWQGKWTGPGFPIYPTWWNEKPTIEKNHFCYTLEDYDKYQKEMAESPADEVLDIKPGIYQLIIDYPCAGYDMPVSIGKGITRQELMDIAAEAYHIMYAYINEGIYAKGINENDEDWNKYGIWGHSMGDLTIHTFYVDEEKNQIKLGVDS